MKGILITNMVLIFISSYGQIDSTNNNLSTPREIIYCEIITLNAVDNLVSTYNANNTDSTRRIINEWENLCGVSECSQRIKIINKILAKEPSEKQIITYFNNDFHYIYYNRLFASKEETYKYIYEGNKSYYTFVPLRHRIDSIIKSRSDNLLKRENLTSDENLICTLFSGKTDDFDEMIKKREYKESYISKKNKHTQLEHKKNWLAFNAYTGVYSSIGASKTFKYNPIIGVSVSSPIKHKLVVDLSVKVRINFYKDEFKFYALGDTNVVSLDESLFIGGFVGYKTFDNSKQIVLPQIGIGLEEISTGLSEQKENSTENTYFDLKTIHISLGFSLMKQVFMKHYLGLGFHYHFCPYGLEKDLYTSFDNSAYSLEMFYRF